MIRSAALTAAAVVVSAATLTGTAQAVPSSGSGGARAVSETARTPHAHVATHAQRRAALRAWLAWPAGAEVRGKVVLRDLRVYSDGATGWATGRAVPKPAYTHSIDPASVVFSFTRRGWAVRDLGTSEVGCTVMPRRARVALHVVC